ncbi:hypothetical protein PR048_028323 [Dryococelus australis]|uniref:Uncharacterized protein n=1 Tax=Dryococelus australis TaxID=614101 RepID=A0ABQ9GIY0_9NEOP|nr:hypothetical protein PR048_028323 [Dryococelus australis]
MLHYTDRKIFLLWEEDETAGNGAEISCVSKNLITELEIRDVHLAFLPVPRIQIVDITSRKGSMVNRQTVIDIEGLGKTKKATVLVVE